MTASSPFTALVNQEVKDNDFFWETATFSVDGYLFQIPKARFIEESPNFFSIIHGQNLGSETDGPVILKGTTVLEFKSFLKVLFPSPTTPFLPSREEWTGILAFTTLFRFDAIRKLAIQALSPLLIATPTEQIRLGRSAFVHDWLFAGYKALIHRDDAITEAECDVIGDRTGIKLYAIRFAMAKVGSSVAPNAKSLAFERELGMAFSEELSSIHEEELKRMTPAEREGVRRKEDEERRATREADRLRLKEEQDELEPLKAEAAEEDRKLAEESEEQLHASLEDPEQRDLVAQLHECREMIAMNEVSDTSQVTRWFDLSVSARSASKSTAAHARKGMREPGMMEVASKLRTTMQLLAREKQLLADLRKCREKLEQEEYTDSLQTEGTVVAVE